MRVNFYGGKTLPQFLESKIKITYNDRGTSETIDAQAHFNVEVGDSNDFTVEIPEFRMDGFSEPSLKARFHWSDSNYYRLMGPQ